MKVHLLIALTLASLAAPSLAQNRLWTVQFGSSANAEDVAMASAPDGSGGVFLAGYTSGAFVGQNAGQRDAWIARYSDAGMRLWVQQFGTIDRDEAWTVSADGAGGVFVGGVTYSYASGSTGVRDAWLRRYDASGNLMWALPFSNLCCNDELYAAAPDGAGGVYIGGRWSSFNAWIARIDATGNQLWSRVFAAFPDRVLAAAPDGLGGVFVGGYTSNSLAGPGSWMGGNDAMIARFDGAGNMSWIRQLGTSGEDVASAAAPDGAGGVYVGGWTDGSLAGGSAGGIDGWVAHYDSAGTQSWIRQLGTPSDDKLDGACFAAGGVHVAGQTLGSLGGPNAGFDDAWVARLDTAGSTSWIRQLGTNTSDMALAVAEAPWGGVYATGRTNGALAAPAALADVWLARYSSSGFSSYCTAGVTTSSCTPSISGAGTPSASAANGFTVAVANVEGQKQGLIFYGADNTGWTPTPWASGSSSYLCVKPPTQRTPIQSSGGTGGACDGTLALDWNAFRAANPGALGAPFSAGQTVYAQAWFRDPPAPKTTNLSNGLQFVLQP